jgi:CheY-like chemotaxis protein
MTIVIGYSELILGTASTTIPFQSEIKEINNAGKRASKLTRQLLAFSRRQVLNPQITNLNVIIPDLDKMLCRVIGEDIKLISILQPELARVKVDPTQIEQVIMNLAINARDAMPKGGKLIIKTAEKMLDDEYAKQHADSISGMHVMLSISDTGLGMDKITRSRIFEPFFTTKEKGKGTGLGLSTVYGIVKQSGGNIWVYSEPGEGTIFKIYFPKAEGETEHTRCSTTFLKALQGDETILLVEDDESVRKVAKKMLMLKGYSVEDTDNPQQALEICKKTKIHVLLTDVVMPVISGADLARQVHDIQPEIKVLFMSGYTDEAIAHHGVLEEGTHFLEKPFTSRDLAIKILETLSDEELG